MTVAQLIGTQRFQLGLLLTKDRLSQCLDRLGNRHLVSRFGNRRGAPQQAQTAKYERARNGQMTPRDTHMLSLPRVLSEALPSPHPATYIHHSESRADRTIVYRPHAI